MHWTDAKLHGYLKEQLKIELGYSTTLRWLHELNFHLRVPQPWPQRRMKSNEKHFWKNCTDSVPIQKSNCGLGRMRSAGRRGSPSASPLGAAGHRGITHGAFQAAPPRTPDS